MISAVLFLLGAAVLWTVAAAFIHNSLHSFMLPLHFWLAAEVGG